MKRTGFKARAPRREARDPDRLRSMPTVTPGAFRAPEPVASAPAARVEKSAPVRSEALRRDVAAELEARRNTLAVQHVQATRPVETVRVPPEDDADFCLMIAARVKADGYVKAGERERVAQIAQEFGPWVRLQEGAFMPTTH